MGNESRHLAVFLPVQGGKPTIVDPASAYLTFTWYGTITAKPTHKKLTRYSSY